ncbi:glycosyltransferase family 4 protein [Candidatus Microgenomates bacterium]|nr:glycosyltransferase family 4 protein [Candidatus Microgenomates bacterium]
MRILYLQSFPLWGSGSGTYARYLASTVGRHFKVGMVVPDNRPIPNVLLFPLKMSFPVAFTGHPEWPDCKLYTQLTNKEIITIYKDYLDSVAEAVEKFQPNIIHVHHAFPLSWVARVIKSTYQTPYIITIHGSELPTVQKDRRYLALTADVLRRARRIVPNSFWTKEWLFKIFGDEFRSAVRVIPGGVDLKKFNPNLDTSDIDKKYGLTGKKVVLFAGKLTVYKGVKYLIKAARKIPAEVVILGEGPERGNLEKRVKDYGLTNVHFIGHLGTSNDLNKFYKRASIFVAPSVWDEPLGLVILEAMASKTPVVVTRKGGIPLAVKDGINGYFVRPRNSSEIAEKVNLLLSDEVKRLKMAENARRIVEEKFSWETIAHRFILMYMRFAYFPKNKNNHSK